MKRKTGAVPASAGRWTTPAGPFDEADWVDWDHWQTVEELQNFMNGLADISALDEAEIAGSSDDGGQRDHIARQILRHGLDVDG
jgi:hypothetical protein